MATDLRIVHLDHTGKAFGGLSYREFELELALNQAPHLRLALRGKDRRFLARFPGGFVWNHLLQRC